MQTTPLEPWMGEPMMSPLILSLKPVVLLSVIDRCLCPCSKEFGYKRRRLRVEWSKVRPKNPAKNSKFFS